MFSDCKLGAGTRYIDSLSCVLLSRRSDDFSKHILGSFDIRKDKEKCVTSSCDTGVF